MTTTHSTTTAPAPCGLPPANHAEQPAALRRIAGMATSRSSANSPRAGTDWIDRDNTFQRERRPEVAYVAPDMAARLMRIRRQILDQRLEALKSTGRVPRGALIRQQIQSGYADGVVVLTQSVISSNRNEYERELNWFEVHCGFIAVVHPEVQVAGR